LRYEVSDAGMFMGGNRNLIRKFDGDENENKQRGKMEWKWELL